MDVLKSARDSGSPESVRGVQRRLSFSYQVDEMFKVGLCHSDAEWAGALGLIYVNYRKLDLIAGNPFGLHATPHHLSPATVMARASFGDETIGTAGLTRDSAMGFPIEAACDLSILSDRRARCAEITGLAARTDVEVEGGLLFPLMKYVFGFAVRQWNIEYILVGLHPRHAGFYKRMFMFDVLHPNVDSHPEYMQGAPVVPLILHIPTAMRTARELYAGSPPEKNLFHYMVEARLPNLVRSRFPQLGCPEGELRSKLLTILGRNGSAHHDVASP